MANPVKITGFRFKMINNIDHRAECVCARSVIKATMTEAALTNEQEGLETRLLFDTLNHALAKPLPIKHRKRPQPQKPLSKEIKLVHYTFAAPNAFAFFVAPPNFRTKMSDLQCNDTLWLRFNFSCTVIHNNCDPILQADPVCLYRHGRCGAYASRRSSCHNCKYSNCRISQRVQGYSR